MLKSILVRSQMEMTNSLLETGGKVILVIKWQRTWCFVELASNEIGYFVDSSRESVERVAWFLLTA